MKKNIYILAMIILVFNTLSGSVLSVEGESYSRTEKVDGKSQSVAVEDTYIPDRLISSVSLGLKEQLSGLTDVFCCKNGDIYILCGGSSRIIVLNNDYSFKKEIFALQNGSAIDYSGAKGIFVKNDGSIYIADTNNSRVIVLDKHGFFCKEYTLPDSSLIPDKFIYQPSKILIDEKNYMYILAQGSYYGALMYSPQDQFMGFYGANTVKASALDTISFFWNKLTKNDAKYQGSMKTLPYSFVDFCIDKDGYIITCSGTTDSSVSSTGQIRKLSPGGANILFKRDTKGGTVSSNTYNFVESALAKSQKKTEFQNLVAVDVDEDGFIYTVDKVYGKIYVYDSECNLLSVFGDKIKNYPFLGGFIMPVALAVNNTDILVIDEQENCITVFKRTEYGKLLHNAQAAYLRADYMETKGMWEKILSKDSGCQIAYRGLAKLNYMERDYEKSYKYAKLGLDYATYDLAYQKLVKNYIKNNFAWILSLAIIILCSFLALLVIFKKGKLPKIKNIKIGSVIGVNIHPFKNFAKIKQKKLHSYKIANIILLSFFIASFLKETVSGFCFNHSTPDSYNIIFTFGKTVGLIITWSAVNVLISSLMGGNGRFKEVYCSTCYCLQPIVVYILLYIPLTWVLPASSVSVLSTIYSVILIYVFFLVAVAIMEMHEYSFSKFVTTSIITVFGMILVIFIIFMIVILLQQLWNFIFSLYIELIYR